MAIFLPRENLVGEKCLLHRGDKGVMLLQFLYGSVFCLSCRLCVVLILKEMSRSIVEHRPRQTDIFLYQRWFKFSISHHTFNMNSVNSHVCMENRCKIHNVVQIFCRGL